MLPVLFIEPVVECCFKVKVRKKATNFRWGFTLILTFICDHHGSKKSNMGMANSEKRILLSIWTGCWPCQSIVFQRKCLTSKFWNSDAQDNQ